MIIVLWGVSGCGKSTIGAQLADRLGCEFLDADDFHPPANKDKMRRGLPLVDDDRWPWLDAIAAQLQARAATGQGVVLACSALKQAYRDRLARARDLQFVQLDGPFDLIASRLAAREHEFMSPALLQSQFDTLEAMPGGRTVSIDQPVAAVCQQIITTLELA